MSFDLKAFLDRELFEKLITKNQLSLKLITFQTTAVAGEQPSLIWLALESKNLAKDLLSLLDAGNSYLDHYRHPMPIDNSRAVLFGCDGMPVPTATAGRARLSRIVPASPGSNVELLLDLYSPGAENACLTAVRAFYDALLKRGIQPADVAKRFARPAAPPQEDHHVTSDSAAETATIPDQPLPV